MTKKSKPIFWLLFIVYVVFLVKMILFNMPFNHIDDAVKAISVGNIGNNLKNANFIPFKHIQVYMDTYFKIAIKNLGMGIILFTPFGYFLPTLTKHRQFKSIVVIGLLTSISFETLQLLMSLGTFDVDDIILNGIGIVFGYMIYKSLR